MGDLNLKAVFQADTKDFSKGIKQAKDDIKNFESVSSGAVDKLGAAFGVNTRKLQEMTSAVRGLGSKLQETGSAGAASMGKLLSSISGVATGIAGIGIAGAVAGFKLLNAEAENFKNTIAGANIELQTAAYVSTYQQVMHDVVSETGKSVAEITAEFEKKWKSTWATVKTMFVTGVVGPGQGFTNVASAFGRVAGGAAVADVNSEKAAQIAEQIYKVQMRLAESAADWAEMEAKIAEYRMRVKDDSLTLAERQAASAAAEQLITQRYQQEYALKLTMYDLQKSMNALSATSVEDQMKEYQLKAQAASVERAMNQELKAIGREQRSLNNEVAKEAAARERILAAERQMTAIRTQMSNTDLSVGASNSLLEKVSGAGVLGGSEGALEIPARIKPEVAEEDIIDIADQIRSVMSSALTDLGESIGTLLGDLVTGGDAIANFKDMALTGFGELLATVGKLAISLGTGILTINEAMVTPGPGAAMAAIAAGVAMVALGSAIKAGLANAAQGNYGSSGYVASSGASAASGGQGYMMNEMNVRVSGTLRGEGSSLVAVIQNEQDRKNTTS